MAAMYPQETVGVTLLEDSTTDERRRVFLRNHMNRLEVGEFSSGSLTEGVYGARTHFHCIHLDKEARQACIACLELEAPVSCEDAIEAFLLGYFDVSRTLADLMDDLDRLGIAYGYLNVQDDGHIRYRPASCTSLVGYVV